MAPAPVSDISAEPARKGPVLGTRVMRAVIRATPLIARAARVEAVEKEGLLAAPEAPAEAPAAPSELPVSSVAIAPPPAAAPPAPAEGAISSVALPASVPPSATPTPPVAPAAVAPPAVAPPAPAPEADEDLPELDETPGSADHTPSAALMARTRPDLYRTNAFRLTGLVVEAASREVARQADRFKMMEKLGQAAQAGGALPVEPPPDAHTLREALQSLNDPERRLLDEVFWFWPRLSGCAAQDGVLQMLQRGEAQQASAEWARQESFESHPYVAVHNMAVLCHALALDLECASAVRPLSAEEIKQRDLYWQEAMRRWRRVVQELRFWRRLLARVRAIDDPRLTAATVHRVRAGLPLALLMINAQLAVRSAEHGDIEEARRHKRVLSSSGFESALVDEALRRAMGPMRDRVEQLCSAAETDIAKDPLNGDQIARRLLDQSRGLLAAFDALLPDGNAARDGAHDDIALRALSAVIAYGNQTKNWPAFRALLEAILKVARRQRRSRDQDVRRCHAHAHLERRADPVATHDGPDPALPAVPLGPLNRGHGLRFAVRRRDALGRRRLRADRRQAGSAGLHPAHRRRHRRRDHQEGPARQGQARVAQDRLRRRSGKTQARLELRLPTVILSCARRHSASA
ncbi:MAG: hypothetical protein MUF51_12050 [Vicinamibacteria bacterium]|nr:hypothetical protein [Vicinamibacteria bacterium]